MRRSVVTAAVVAFIVSVLLLPSMGSAQTINACVKQNGTIRIVAAGSSCERGDTPLLWNSGLRVYDANGVEIGPLSGVTAVMFYMDGQGYSAGVGPGGWIQSQTTFYYFDAACDSDRYVLRSTSTSAPPPLQTTFFTSLQVLQTTPGYYTGFYQVDPPVQRTLVSGVTSVWRRDMPSASCVPFNAAGTYWFSGHATVELPAHPAPFTIR
jgi:hypothetical protein